MGDTLDDLVEVYQTSVKALVQANCLQGETLIPGSQIYLPPLPTATPTPCGAPPLRWVVYVVQQHDTLYHLSQVFDVSVSELQQANCLGSSTAIYTGQNLYVPPSITMTPSPSYFPPTYSTYVGTPTPTPNYTLTETYVVTYLTATATNAATVGP